jgi:hypothetical protein
MVINSRGNANIGAHSLSPTVVGFAPPLSKIAV